MDSAEPRSRRKRSFAQMSHSHSATLSSSPVLLREPPLNRRSSTRNLPENTASSSSASLREVERERRRIDQRLDRHSQTSRHSRTANRPARISSSPDIIMEGRRKPRSENQFTIVSSSPEIMEERRKPRSENQFTIVSSSPDIMEERRKPRSENQFTRISSSPDIIMEGRRKPRSENQFTRVSRSPDIIMEGRRRPRSENQPARVSHSPDTIMVGRRRPRSENQPARVSHSPDTIMMGRRRPRSENQPARVSHSPDTIIVGRRRPRSENQPARVSHSPDTIMVGRRRPRSENRPSQAGPVIDLTSDADDDAPIMSFRGGTARMSAPSNAPPAPRPFLPGLTIDLTADDDDDDDGEDMFANFGGFMGGIAARAGGPSRNHRAQIPPMPGVMDYNQVGGLEDQKREHVPPPPVEEGFTRSPKATDVAICPCCEEELIRRTGVSEEPQIAEKSSKASARKDREEHPFWVVKECGHVFCNKCFQNRATTFQASLGSKKIYCVVEDCVSDIRTKDKWVGVFL